MGERIESHGATDVGAKRAKNEDYYAILDTDELFILADGMGGHASGQVASRLATEHIIEFLTVTCRAPGFDWPYPVQEGMTFEEQAVSNAIQFANERTYLESLEDTQLEGMGTTICVLLGVGDRLVLGHVGDSRIYRYRNGELQQMTRDHSLLNHYLDIGAISPDEVGEFKSKNVIVRAVGLKDNVDPEVQMVPRQPGDIYLMCSDGLTDLVEDWVIQATIASESDDLEEVGRRLLRLAYQGGGKDNTTVVLLRLNPSNRIEATDPIGVPAQPQRELHEEVTSPRHRSPTAPDGARLLADDDATPPAGTVRLSE